MRICLVLIFILKLSLFGCHGCTFPGDLRGDWFSTQYGTLTFNDTSFSGFPVQTINKVLTFTCIATSGNQYVST